MTATQTTSNKPTTFKFKVGDDLQVIDKLREVLELTPLDYVYNAKEGTITTNKVTKTYIDNRIKDLGFDFLLGNSDSSNKNYKVKPVTIEVQYINLNSINIAYQKLYAEYKQVLGLIETRIDHNAKKVIVTANVRVATFNELDYKVALILTNFSYVVDTNKSTRSFKVEQDVAYDELCKSINKFFDELSSDFNKSAPSELKTLVNLFLT